MIAVGEKSRRVKFIIRRVLEELMLPVSGLKNFVKIVTRNAAVIYYNENRRPIPIQEAIFSVYRRIFRQSI